MYHLWEVLLLHNLYFWFYLVVSRLGDFFTKYQLNWVETADLADFFSESDRFLSLFYVFFFGSTKNVDVQLIEEKIDTAIELYRSNFRPSYTVCKFFIQFWPKQSDSSSISAETVLFQSNFDRNGEIKFFKSFPAWFEP